MQSLPISCSQPPVLWREADTTWCKHAPKIHPSIHPSLYNLPRSGVHLTRWQNCSLRGPGPKRKKKKSGLNPREERGKGDKTGPCEPPCCVPTKKKEKKKRRVTRCCNPLDQADFWAIYSKHTRFLEYTAMLRTCTAPEYTHIHTHTQFYPRPYFQKKKGKKNKQKKNQP